MRDTAMFSIIDKEAKRQKQNVELIAIDQQIRRRVSRQKILWWMCLCGSG